MCAAISRATPAACASASWLASVTAGLPPLLPRAGPALRAAATAGLLPADRPGAVRAASLRLGGRDGDLVAAGVRRLVLRDVAGHVDIGGAVGACVRPGRRGHSGRGSRRGGARGGHGRGGGTLGRPAAGRPPPDPHGQLLVLRL